MRVLFELLLLSIVVGAVTLFFIGVYRFMFPKYKSPNKEKSEDGK